MIRSLPPMPRAQPRWARILTGAVALLTGAMVLALLMRFARDAGDAAAVPLILVGMVLVIGSAAGRLAAACGLPRLTGYLLSGVLISPGLWDVLGHPALFVAREQLPTLGPATDLAVGILGLMAGLEIEAGWLRQRFAAVCAVAGAETLLVPGALAVAVLLLPDPPFLSAAVAAGLPPLLPALLAGCLLLPNGPTVVVTVLSETAASGPLSRMLMGASVVLDALGILLFSLVLAFTANAASGGSSLIGAAFSAVGGLGLSLVLGGGIGWGLRWIAERTERRLAWLVVGLAVVVSALSRPLGIAPLFCLLAAGFAFGNLPGDGPAVEQARHRLKRTLAQVGMPVFVVFFCAAGLSVNPLSLLAGGLSFIVLLVLRDLLIAIAVRLGVRGAEPAVRRHLWVGMVTQAGVSLALAAMVRDRFPGWGDDLANLVVAMVTIHEIWVPVVLVAALRSAGETGDVRRS